MNNQVHQSGLRAQQDWPLRGPVNASNSPTQRVRIDFVSRPGKNGEVLIYHPDVPRNANPSDYEMEVLLPTDGHLKYTSTLWASIPRQQKELLLKWEFSWNTGYGKWEVQEMLKEKRRDLHELRKRNKGLTVDQLLESYNKTQVFRLQASRDHGQTLMQNKTPYAPRHTPDLANTSSSSTLSGGRSRISSSLARPVIGARFSQGYASSSASSARSAVSSLRSSRAQSVASTIGTSLSSRSVSPLSRV
jgi:hypothetical protein